MKLRSLTIAMLLATLTACGKNERSKQSGGEVALADTALLGARSGPIGMTDRQVLTWLTRLHEGEVEISELARTRATDEEIKRLGQEMRVEHLRLAREGGMLAKQLRPPTAEDSAAAAALDSLAAHQTRTMNALRSVSGEALDRLVAKELTANHARRVDTLRKWTGKALDPKLNTAMEKALPIEERHLTEARRIDERLKKVAKARADSVRKAEREKAKADSLARAAKDTMAAHRH